MSEQPNQLVRRAFTTLEVLCATALSAMLMVAVMGLVAGLSRHERILRDKSPQADWQRRLTRQLKADLGRAWNLALLPDGFQLTGPLGRDLTTGAPTWKNARVTYRILESPLGTILVRELASDLERSTASHLEIACFGAVAIELCAATDMPAWQPALTQRLETTLAAGPLPKQLRVLVYGAYGRPLVDQLCHVR